MKKEVARKINPASFYSPWQEVKSHVTLAEMSASNYIKKIYFLFFPLPTAADQSLMMVSGLLAVLPC